MIDRVQFLNEIIIPTLDGSDYDSESARMLIWGTCIQESLLTYLRQIGGGPAISLGQMEPATHGDIYVNYLQYRDELLEWVQGGNQDASAERMVYDLRYMVKMIRVHYLRAPEALPPADDDYRLGAYWKQYYNTVDGAGTVGEFVEKLKEAKDLL